MIYEWRNIKDLRKASIFDLTDDIKVIRVCTGYPHITVDQREEYEENLGEWERVVTFCMLYREDYDKEFLKALKEAFPIVFKDHPELPDNVFWE